MNNEINRIVYPRLIRRVQALLIDSAIFSFLIATLFLLMPTFENSPRWFKVVVFLLPIFILEPGLVSLTGGTIGHHLIKLRVQNAHSNKNINIIFATIRFIIKTALGWMSLISVLTTRKHQAIHDFLVNSVVVYKDASQVPSHEALTERVFKEEYYVYPSKLRSHEALTERVSKEEYYVYPSKLRRLLIILMYNILFFLLLGGVISMLVSDMCIEHDACTTKEKEITYIAVISWFLAILCSLVFGWNSRLWGCRRKRKEPRENITKSDVPKL